MSRFTSSSTRLVLMAAVLACSSGPAVSGQKPTTPAPSSASVESAILRSDWFGVVRLSGSDRTLNATVQRLVKAHALLALNRVDEALCLFVTPPATEDAARWEQWARGLATRHPQSAAAYYFLGDAQARQKKWGDAFRSFQTSLDRDSTFTLTLNARAVAFAVTGDIDRALLDLQSATAVSPLLGDLYLNKGYVYVQSNVAIGARNAFNRALQLMPDSALATGGLGYVQVIENKWADGKHNIETAGGRNACLSQILANNLASIVDWEAQGASTQLTSADTQDLGTTIDNLFRKVGQGDTKAAQEILKIGADHPETRTKITLTSESMNKTSPIAAKALADAVATSGSQARQRADQLGTVESLRTQSSISADAKGTLTLGTGPAKLTVGAGATAGAQQETVKSGPKLKEQADKTVEFFKDMEKAVPGGKKISPELGGVTTSMSSAARVSGHWPIRAHYTLSYSASESSK